MKLTLQILSRVVNIWVSFYHFIFIETCRQLGARGYTVILTARREQEGQAATEALLGEWLDIHFRFLDVTD